MAVSFFECFKAVARVPSIWTVSGTVAYDSTNSGYEGIKCTSGASGAVATAAIGTCVANGKFNFFLYMHDLPTAACTIAIFNPTTLARFWLRVDNSGTLTITDTSGNARGTWAGSMTTATQYRICVTWNVTNTTTNHIKVFVTTTPFALSTSPVIDVTNVTIGASVAQNLTLGWGTASVGNSLYMFFSHPYEDNSSDLADLGNVLTSFKNPASDVSVNHDTFSSDPGVGSRYTLVNNNNEASYMAQAATAQVSSTLGIQAIGTGDVDLTIAQILAVKGWMRAKITSTTGGPTVALIESSSPAAKTLTTSPADYTDTNAYSTYPTNIGQRSSGSSGDTYLYDCGFMFAYIPRVSVQTTASAYEESRLGLTGASSGYEESRHGLAVTNPAYEESLIELDVMAIAYEESILGVPLGDPVGNTADAFHESMLGLAVEKISFQASKIGLAITKAAYEESLLRLTVLENAYQESEGPVSLHVMGTSWQDTLGWVTVQGNAYTEIIRGVLGKDPGKSRAWIRSQET